MTNYKETLNLPKTEFPMRANLGEREPEQIQKWDNDEIYKRMQKRRKDQGAQEFILHDGPPYANGELHHGHVLNKALKDFVVKYKTMAGFYTPFIPGWDCHGLPIEHNVEKSIRESGRNMADVSQLEIRKLCREYANKFIDIQRDQFKRIMVFGDWDQPYLTMNYNYEAATLRELGTFFKKDLVYRGLKPVHWDWASQTALAEAEIEYRAFKTEHVYVKFPIDELPDAFKDQLNDKKTSVVIWTTTPWTLPSNLAIAIGPDLMYSFVTYGDDAYLIADGLREDFEKACQLEPGNVLVSFEGKELVGELGAPIQYRAKHPFIDRPSPLVPAAHVTLEQGTGAVHTAPGHGVEDFQLGKFYDLGVVNPVDNAGHYIKGEVPLWDGMHVFKANKEIQKHLSEIGALVNQVGDRIEIERYPHGWRSKKPVIYRATTQWFVAIDGKESEGLKNKADVPDDVMNVRETTLEAIDRIGWVPAWGRERIVGMVENRPDWCISRQRAWGVPITVFKCKACGQDLVDGEVTYHIADLFEKEGADAWFSRSPEDLVPEGTTCRGCGATPQEFEKEADILDVWFDSGTSWAAVVEGRLGVKGTADLYLEGSDQHRGWFNSSLTCKLITRGSSPFRTCLTHGFVNDENGHKYSKSSKNFEPPQKMIDEMGAEILRLWAAAVDYRSDITLSPEIIGRISDAYRKIRNTIRYLLGNLHDFSAEDVMPYGNLEEIDQWLLDRTGRALETVRQAYDAYQFHTVFHTLVQLCTVDLSSVHMDVSKDRIYCESPTDPRRRSAQSAYWLALSSLLRAMAPILSFTAEEAYHYFPKEKDAPDSIFLTDFPLEHTKWIDDHLADRWNQLLEIRSDVQKRLEEIRVPKKQKKPGQIGSSQEALVSIQAEGKTYDLLEKYKDHLAELFITSGASIDRGEDPELKIKIVAADGGKCPRCWNYWSEDDQSLCPRCKEVVA